MKNFKGLSVFITVMFVSPEITLTQKSCIFTQKNAKKCSIKILMRPRTQDVDLNSLHLLWMLYRFLLFEWRKKWVTWVRWITKVRQKCYFSKKFQSCKWQCYQSEWWFPSQANANSILTILAFARRDASKKLTIRSCWQSKYLNFIK